jgi:sarcosine oxidase
MAAGESSGFVVVGAGLTGAATAWQLARRGHEVTVLERSTPANAQGSSHGSARIVRYAYADRFYTRLMVSARAEWDELERLAGTTLITPTGAVDAGRDPAQLAAVLAAVGVEHELVPAAAAADRWPQLAVGGPVLWHPGAGVLDAESAVLTMLRLAEAAGARVETGWPVTSVERSGPGLRVRGTEGRAVEAGHVVVAAGGWLPGLLGDLGLPAPLLGAFPALAVTQENAFHFPYATGVAPAASWPTVIHDDGESVVYALPGGRDAGFAGQKVAEFRGGRDIGTAAAQDGRIDPANRRRTVEYVRRAMPGLVPEPYAETTCLFTSTPTDDFVIDGADGVTVASPCSGHGAKFAPLLGRIVADAATGVGVPPAPFRVGAAGR